jgi:hypothetical protein
VWEESWSVATRIHSASTAIARTPDPKVQIGERWKTYLPIGVKNTNARGASRAMAPYFPNALLFLESMGVGKQVTGS